MKKYVAFSDGRIGVIKDICTCVRCKERGQAELFIDDLDGAYLDCIKCNDVKDIIYIGESIAKAISTFAEHCQSIIRYQEKEKKYLQSIIDYYCSQIIK